MLTIREKGERKRNVERRIVFHFSTMVFVKKILFTKSWRSSGYLFGNREGFSIALRWKREIPPFAASAGMHRAENVFAIRSFCPEKSLVFSCRMRAHACKVAAGRSDRLFARQPWPPSSFFSGHADRDDVSSCLVFRHSMCDKMALLCIYIVVGGCGKASQGYASDCLSCGVFRLIPVE